MNMSSRTDTAKSEKRNGPAQRLPVNPRRRKIPAEQRKRASRACNACNVRRVKCSGEDPCSRCVSNSQNCEYPPAKDKAAVSREEYDELQQRCLILEKCLADVVLDATDRETLLSKWALQPTQRDLSAASKIYGSGTTSRDEELENERIEGRVLQDPDGYVRYLGESSGAAFIDRLREFVGTIFPLLESRNTTGKSFSDPDLIFTSLLGRYHTHDSKPLLLPDVDPMYLPELEVVSKLVATFRLYAADGDGHSSHGGIYHWGDLDYIERNVKSPAGLASMKENLHQLCNLNAIMALACQYEPANVSPWESFPGESFFARAKSLLINPMEEAKLVNLRTLCLMGQYLLGLHRRDAAFMYIGLGVRIAVIHGLHRKGTISEISKDFWNTFILDRWLSCLMGRPPTISREAITVDLPMDELPVHLDVEEDPLYANPHSPKTAGLRAHAQLALIMDEIVNNVYGIARTQASASATRELSRPDTVLQKLSTWYAQLPSCLQHRETTGVKDRASVILHMMYNQLIILCTRPSLFQATKQAIATKYLPSQQHRRGLPNTKYVNLCADAARTLTKLTRNLVISNQAAVLANVDYHFAFSAAIVLELYTLVSTTQETEDDDRDVNFLAEYLTWAGDSGNESAADCARIVRDFGAIADTLRAQTVNVGNASGENATGSHTSVDPTRTGDVMQEGASASQEVGDSNSAWEGDNVFQGREATYEELFSWFISESPIGDC